MAARVDSKRFRDDHNTVHGRRANRVSNAVMRGTVTVQSLFGTGRSSWTSSTTMDAKRLVSCLCAKTCFVLNETVRFLSFRARLLGSEKTADRIARLSPRVWRPFVPVPLKVFVDFQNSFWTFPFETVWPTESELCRSVLKSNQPKNRKIIKLVAFINVSLLTLPWILF